MQSTNPTCHQRVLTGQNSKTLESLPHLLRPPPGSCRTTSRAAEEARRYHVKKMGCRTAEEKKKDNSQCTPVMNEAHSPESPRGKTVQHQTPLTHWVNGVMRGVLGPCKLCIPRWGLGEGRCGSGWGRGAPPQAPCGPGRGRLFPAYGREGLSELFF